jgi:general secretion pathway protein E
VHDALIPLSLAKAEPFFLVSPWKPVLLLLPFIPWAWFVSKVMDKHAARFLLPREKFNLVHLIVGTAAVLVAIAVPVYGEIAFWIGFAAMCGILLADLLIFINIHNKDERVPERFRLSLVDFTKFKEAQQAKKVASALGKVELQIKSPDKSIVAAPNADTPEYGVRVSAEAMYMKGGAARATQVELAPTGKDNAFRVQMLVDGIPIAGDAVPGADALKLIDFWKSAAKLDLNERRKKQQGDITVTRADIPRKLRVSTIGSQAGPRLTLLFDPDKAVQRDAAELGLLDLQRKEVDEIVPTAGGLVLLAAPPDGGRTTTFYTVMRMHDAYTRNVQTVELDPQMSLEGVRQNKYDAAADGPEYATLVRSILRRDPDVLGIAELPDAQTAKEIARADLERCRVYVSARGDSALQALQGWYKLVGDPDLASKQLKAVLAQRLIRKLCNNCKSPYTPSPDMLKKLGLPADQVKQLYKKGGQVQVKDKVQTCPSCDGGGYFGQEGIYEIFTIGAAERALIKSGDWNGLKLELRKRKLPTIQQAALRKALDGITSIEEVLRVTAEAPATPATPAAASAPAAGGAAPPAPQPAKG